jgi:hypothetical protein
MDIAKWDAGTWIAVAGAVIALVAAWSAWRQAAAAKDQVVIMRQQLNNETADRHKAAGPNFEVASSRSTRAGQKPVADVGVKQVGGPRVTVTVKRDGDVRGLIEDGGDNIVDSIIWTDNAPGQVRSLKVGLERDKRVNVVLDFVSVEKGNEEPWKCTVTTRPEGTAQFGVSTVGSP